MAALTELRRSRAHLTLVVGQPAAGPPDVAMPADAEAPDDRLVAAAVATTLAEVTDELMGSAPLALPLALSICMERHGVEADVMVQAMRLLRRVLLSVSGLDAVHEPVPFASGDAPAAALALGEYLHGLLGRAASQMAAERQTVASTAAAELIAC